MGLDNVQQLQPVLADLLKAVLCNDGASQSSTLLLATSLLQVMALFDSNESQVCLANIPHDMLST